MFYYYTKLQLFLLKHRSFCTFVFFLVFYCFFVSSLNDITFCVEPDGCEQAYKESLKDAQQQIASDSWGKKIINGIALDGKNGKLGTAAVEKDGKVYVNQLFEFIDKDGTTLRRLADCVSAHKKK